MRWLLTISLIVSGFPLWAQGVFISKFTPGNYLSDNLHCVELGNPTGSPLNIGGYLVITRNYSMRLAVGTSIQPRGLLRIGKQSNSGQSFDVQLSNTQDFLIRFNLNDDEGNYVCLIDPKGQVVDAFYHSPQPNVPFLPDRDTLITFSGTRISFYLPPENRQTWKYLSYGDDPGTSFYQRLGKWQLSTTGSPSTPLASYQDFSARYFDGIVTLKWSTSFEQDVISHVIERSEDQENFTRIGQVLSKGNSDEYQFYPFYDKEIQNGKTYSYRVKGVDGVGNEVFSQIRSIQAEDGISEFEMEVILVPFAEETELSLRFTSQYSQDVQIKLLNEQMAEVAILFDDYVFARRPNLLKMARRLPAGRYTVLATTETKRFGQDILIQ